MTYILYTKTGCPSCDKAKQLLKREAVETIYINCDEMLRLNRQEFINSMRRKTGIVEPQSLMFPLIFLDDNYLGGVEELVEHLIFEFEEKDGYCSDYEF